MKKTILFLVMVVLVFIGSLYPLAVFNDIVPAFPESERGIIEDNVIEGATNYLVAKSHIALIVAEYEKSAKQSLDYESALSYTDKAIDELEVSLKYYNSGIELGKRAGYVTPIIEKFKKFDYQSLTISKKLNESEMARVKGYFSIGNILGAYQQNVENISGILITLKQIREDLAVNKTPGIQLIWQLLQQESSATLFGNYCTLTATEVFKN